MKSVWEPWSTELEARLASDLARSRPTLESPQDVRVQLDGQNYLSFCSNDYLGLACDSTLAEAAKTALEEVGVGGGASHLVVGHHQEHHMLEEELAAFTGRERALVFSSGYMANVGVISTLVGKGGLILQDKLNHASLIDGGLLSGARFQRYQHNDVESLRRYLEKFSDLERKLVATDGVFSMDGDCAPLADIAAVCGEQNALLMVDDAHGFGVLGATGGGLIQQLGLSQEQVPVLVGTFGKAFGTAGAFVAGSAELIEYLVQFARPYIYTTSMPPAMAATTRASLRLIQDANDKRQHLNKLIRYFRSEAGAMGFQLADSETPIQPLIVGESEKAMALSGFLRAMNIFVTAIRPPTVPQNTARLRITFSANHRFEQVDQLLNALALASGELGLDLADRG